MIFAWIWRQRQKERSRPLIDDVFTPGGEPSVTYVDREQLGLEKKIRSALQRRHSFIVVSGPTKCGKSVLCKRVLGNQLVVKVDGGMVTSVNDFWDLISHQLRLPTSATTTIAASRYETDGTIKAWFDSFESGDSTRLSELIESPPRVNRQLAGRGRLDIILSHLGLINVDLVPSGMR
jgi:hypothetical protein